MSGKGGTDNKSPNRKHAQPKVSVKSKGQAAKTKKIPPPNGDEWRLLVECTPDVIVKLNRQGKILYINRAFSGQPTKNVLGKRIFDFIPSESWNEVKKCIEEVLKTGKTVRFDTTASGPDGHNIWYSGRFGLLDRSKGYLICTSWISTEIAEHEKTKEALLESETKLRSLIETLGEGVGFVDENETFRFANPAAEEILGVTPGKLVGRNLCDFLGPKCTERVRRETGKRKRGISSTYELVIIRTNGQKRDIMVTASPNRDAAGKFTGSFAAFRDITSQKQIQKQIQHRLEVEKALSQASAWLVSGKRGNINSAIRALGEAVDVNHTYIFEFNEELSRMHNTHWWSARGNRPQKTELQEVDLTKARWWMDKLTRGENIILPNVDNLGKEAAIEKDYLKRAGVQSILAVPIHSQAGQLLGFIGFDDMVSPREWLPDDVRALRVIAEIIGTHLEREQTERVKALLTTAVEQTVEGMLISDRNGIIEYVNPAFTQITGFTRDDVIGQTPRIFENGLHDEAFYKTIWQAVQRGEVWSGEMANQRKDGHFYEAYVTISPVKDKDGQIISFVSVMRDITEQLALEANLRQAQKLQAVGQLAAGIAHEINTPTQYVKDNTHFLQDAFTDLLNVISEYERVYEAANRGQIDLEQLKRLNETLLEADPDYLNEEIPKAVEQSLEGLGRIAEIVLAMKDFIRSGFEEKTLTNLNKAIENTITITKNEWKYAADIETDLDPDLPTVPCFPGEFNQVILNLILNAVHAIEDVVGLQPGLKGRIGISTRAEGDWVEIKVSDTGGGIPAEIQDRIWEPFFTSKDIGRGTGQGLAISHSVTVEKHGGTISFDSEVGRGTTFTIRLPILEDTEEMETEDEATHSVC